MHAIIHIGSPKAGSTTLQAALRHGKAALADQDIFAYAGDPRVISTPYVNPHKPLVPQERLRFSTRKQAIDSARGDLSELFSRIKHDRPKVVLLSSEHLLRIHVKGAFLDDVLRVFDTVTLVAYIRDPVGFYASAVDQQIRGGRRFAELPTPDSFPYDFYTHLQRYSALTGRVGLVVRNMARSNLVNGSVVDDFFSLVGDLTGIRVPPPQDLAPRNESLPAVATLWLLSLNEELDIRNSETDIAVLERRFGTIAALRDAAALKQFPKLRLDHPPLMGALRQATRGACTAINEQFLAGQEQLPVEQGGDVTPPEDVRAEMQHWFLGYLDAGAVAALYAFQMGRSDTAPTR